MLIMIVLVLALNLVMCITAFFIPSVMHWGMLLSFIGSICMLFNSLTRISKTIKSVKDAFPNEKFVWINVWNLIFFAILLVITYSTALLRDYIEGQKDEEQMTDDEKLNYLTLVLVHETFAIIQYVFALYMDMFLLYLILRFTRPSQDS